MKKLLNILGFCFVFILFLPFLQKRLQIFPKVYLSGELKKLEKPEFTLKSWLNGKFQTQFEKQLNRKISFLGFLVKTENQINYSIFKEISAKTDAPIALGKEGWLFETFYINAYNNGVTIPDSQTNQYLKAYKDLQVELDKIGKAFLLVISTSKAEIYPEYIPYGMLKKTDKPHESNYLKAIPILNGYGINCVDGHKIFIEGKKNSPYPLFTIGGTHWNYYGAFIIVKEIIQELEKQFNKPLVNLDCESVLVDRKTKGTENDIGNLINIWSKNTTKGLTPHPQIIRKETGEEFYPRILFIGRSFCITLMEIMDICGVYKSRDFLYYFRTIKKYPENTSLPIDPETFDLKKILLSVDAVVIEVNETALPGDWNSYVLDMVRALRD